MFAVPLSLSLCLSLGVQISDLSWLTGTVEVPFLLVPKVTKGKFHMAPPTSVDLIGSYPLGTCNKPRVTVDLSVTMPAVSCLPSQQYSISLAIISAII